MELYATNRSGLKIYFYAIMDNHTYFLLGSDKIETLSEEMHRINLRYEGYYNFENNRSGHVFQNRFKSVEVNSLGQMFETLRYIHNNPLIAGLSIRLADYEFTSFNTYFSDRKGIVDKEFMSAINDNFESLENFAEFHQEPLMKLCLDVEDDTRFYKKRFLYNINEFEIGEKVELMYKMGFSVREISTELNLSKSKVHRV